MRIATSNSGVAKGSARPQCRISLKASGKRGSKRGKGSSPLLVLLQRVRNGATQHRLRASVPAPNQYGVKLGETLCLKKKGAAEGTALGPNERGAGWVTIAARTAVGAGMRFGQPPARQNNSNMPNQINSPFAAVVSGWTRSQSKHQQASRPGANCRPQSRHGGSWGDGMGRCSLHAGKRAGQRKGS